MGQSLWEEYWARAEECARQAESAKDANVKLELLKLAKSWQVLARRKKPLKSFRQLLIKTVARSEQKDMP
jgi:hypothetical protein